MVTQIAFLLRSYASFELPKRSVCWLMFLTRTPVWILWWVGIYFWFLRKWLTSCLLNRYNYSHTSLVGKLDFPCISTNREATISKDVLKCFSPRKSHRCQSTQLHRNQHFSCLASWSSLLLLILSGCPTLTFGFGSVKLQCSFEQSKHPPRKRQLSTQQEGTYK